LPSSSSFCIHTIFNLVDILSLQLQILIAAVLLIDCFIRIPISLQSYVLYLLYGCVLSTVLLKLYKTVAGINNMVSYSGVSLSVEINWKNVKKTAKIRRKE